MSKDDWQTPPEIFNKLDQEFRFVLDVACSENNILGESGLCVEFCNSLEIDWFHESIIEDTYAGACWMNPPYSKPNLFLFCRKAFHEAQKGCTIVGLLPCDCSTYWFEEYVMKAAEIRFCSRRVQFLDPDTGKRGKNGPTFGSIIVVWRPKHETPDSPEVSVFEWDKPLKTPVVEEKTVQAVLTS